jgi:putative salt-induced outer membrane protein
VFGQASWLTDRYNGYQQRDVLTAGYGRQILNGPVHSLRFEFGPGVRYDEYTDGDNDTQPLGYASGTWAWQMTDNAKFTQGVSVFGAGHDAELGKCADVAINAHFALRVAYNLTWNSSRRHRRRIIPIAARRCLWVIRCNLFQAGKPA